MTTRKPAFPRPLLARAALAAVPLLFCSALAADELRLTDGRVLVGEVHAKTIDGVDVYEVHTRDGLVIVPRAQVEKLTTDEDLRKDLAGQRRNADSTPFAYLQLASTARSYGLEPEMWRYLEKAVKGHADAGEKQQTSKALERLLRDFLAQLEPEVLPRKYRAATTEVRVRKLLAQARVGNQPGRALAIEELLVREQNADATLRREARGNDIEHRRIVALKVLARRGQGQQEPTRFVLRTTILDRKAEVRSAAADILREGGFATEGAVQYLAPGLYHHDARVRERTADAYAALDNPAAIVHLVAAGPHAATARAPAAGGTGTRGHIAILNQQAYIRDFDVEVAQASFIADPKVDVLQSGTVLDVTVAGIWEERVQTRIVRTYRRALNKLAKNAPNVGPDPSDWGAWHRELLARQEQAATTPDRR